MTESGFAAGGDDLAFARLTQSVAEQEGMEAYRKAIKEAIKGRSLTPSKCVLSCLTAAFVCYELTGFDDPYKGDCFQEGSEAFTAVTRKLESAFPQEWTGQAADDYKDQNQKLITLAHTLTNLDTGMKSVVNGQSINVTNTREKLADLQYSLIAVCVVVFALEKFILTYEVAWGLAVAAVATTAFLCGVWMSECHSDSATNAATAQGFDYQAVITVANEVKTAAQAGFPPGKVPAPTTGSHARNKAMALPSSLPGATAPGNDTGHNDAPPVTSPAPPSLSSPASATGTPAAPITPHPTTTMPAAAAPFGAPPTLDEISQVSQQVSAPLTMASQTVNQVGQTASQAAQQIQSLAQSAKGPGSADPAHTPARDDAPTASDGVTPVDTAAASSGPAAGRAPVDAPTPAAASGGDPLAAERSAPN